MITIPARGRRPAAASRRSSISPSRTAKDTLQQAVDNWHAKAAGKACVDYSFHLAITHWDQQKKELKKMIDQGIPPSSSS